MMDTTWKQKIDTSLLFTDSRSVFSFPFGVTLFVAPPDIQPVTSTTARHTGRSMVRQSRRVLAASLHSIPSLWLCDNRRLR